MTKKLKSNRKKQPPTVKDVYDKHAHKFETVFHARLSQYWDKNGLMMQPFYSQLLEYDGHDPYTRASSKFGKAGRQLIKSIVHDLGEPW